MELLIMIDAFKRASAGRITAVIPYYAYGRTDKKDQPRVPITARLLADMHQRRRAPTGVLTMDLHAGPDPGLLQHPGRRADGRAPARAILSSAKELDDLPSSSPTWASPSRRATSPRCSTRRWPSSRSAASATTDKAEPLNVIGDVARQAAPSSSTTRSTRRARSWRSSARSIREGVTDIYACAMHGVLSDPAIDRLRNSEIKEIVITDTIPLPPEKQSERITVLSVRRFSARRSSASTAASPSEHSSPTISSWSRRCSCGTSRTTATTTANPQKRGR